MVVPVVHDIHYTVFIPPEATLQVSQRAQFNGASSVIAGKSSILDKIAPKLEVKNTNALPFAQWPPACQGLLYTFLLRDANLPLNLKELKGTTADRFRNLIVKLGLPIEKYGTAFGPKDLASVREIINRARSHINGNTLLGRRLGNFGVSLPDLSGEVSPSKFVPVLAALMTQYAANENKAICPMPAETKESSFIEYLQKAGILVRPLQTPLIPNQ